MNQERRWACSTYLSILVLLTRTSVMTPTAIVFFPHMLMSWNLYWLPNCCCYIYIIKTAGIYDSFPTTVSIMMMSLKGWFCLLFSKIWWHCPQVLSIKIQIKPCYLYFCTLFEISGFSFFVSFGENKGRKQNSQSFCSSPTGDGRETIKYLRILLRFIDCIEKVGLIWHNAFYIRYNISNIQRTKEQS